ncbi:hypothetical protein G6F22_013749 [Rhizopus arrhizus]|nr:hypothetical protein G6F22_013749 [Rhizopus arrhizus]
MLPGDPARLAAGQEADQQTVELVRKELGLDLPLPQQFVRYFSHMLQGDLGTSLRTKRPVSTEISDRFMPTLWLTMASMAWSVTFGMIIGIVSAVWRNRWPDRLGMTLAVSGISFPAFALGMMLMQVFSVNLGWLPTVGASSWKHYILPSLTLGAAVAAVMARFTRASFVEVIQEDFVRTARAKGLTERRVVIKHALRNALIPVVTMMGLQFGFLLGGSIVVETVFNWPGLGTLAFDAISGRDYPVLQGTVTVLATVIVLVNLIVDIAYGIVDPRIRTRRYRSLEFVLGALLTGVMVLLVLTSGWLFPDGGESMDLAARLMAPFSSAAHPFGTDPLGRDVLARVIVGGKISLMVGFAWRCPSSWWRSRSSPSWAAGCSTSSSS